MKTALEYAEENDKKTGLVASCSITHATPAVFVAHVDSRAKQDVIAEHIVTSGVDVLFGGGWAFFVPKSVDGKTWFIVVNEWREPLVYSLGGLDTLEGVRYADPAAEREGTVKNGALDLVIRGNGVQVLAPQ